MMKTIAVAALFAAAFTAPTISVQAASLMSDDTNCLVFPLLKQECRDMAMEHMAMVSDRMMAAPMAAAEATADAADATADAADAAADATVDAAAEMNWPVLPWWNCTPAEAGSGHMFDCAK